jgi:energy-coupling factor transporter transmembrane protein EcfT
MLRERITKMNRLDNKYKHGAKGNWIQKISRKTQIMLVVYIAIIVFLCICKVTVFAATTDPLEAVNNLSTFIFGLIRAIGLILVAFGIVQIGLSLKSHDPSQRANGFLTFAGGIVITFVKEILTLIAG